MLNESLEPGCCAAQSISALPGSAEFRPVDQMAYAWIAHKLYHVLALAQGDEELEGFAKRAAQIVISVQKQQWCRDAIGKGESRAILL